MRISAVNSALSHADLKNRQNAIGFKGFMGKSHTRAISMPRWDRAIEAACGTYHTITTLTYYKFSDDKKDDVDRFISENTYIRTSFINPNPHSVNKYNMIEEGNVRVKEIPLTAKEYYNYVGGKLQASQNDKIKTKLKKAKLRELVKHF